MWKRLSRRYCGAVLMAAMALPCAASPADYRAQRDALIVEIEADVRATSSYLKKSSLDTRVLEALRAVPRHLFVPSGSRSNAYDNRPLPIGHGQTISQPYIVAIMTELLEVASGDKVLEIGTGSGYQAAVLAELTDDVYTIEIVEPLAREAAIRLRETGYRRVTTRIGDGYFGWKAHAPFDAIIVTAAANHIPPSLIRQLRPGGRMIIPVGGRFMVQQLVVVEKDINETVTTRQMLPVRFVPFTGSHDKPR